MKLVIKGKSKSSTPSPSFNKDLNRVQYRNFEIQKCLVDQFYRTSFFDGSFYSIAEILYS